MVERKSLGNDPLDWIGGGTTAPSKSDRGITQTARVTAEKSPEKPPEKECETTPPPARIANAEAATELELPPIPGSDDSTLERELLLMEVQEFRAPARARRRRRSNRVLLALVLIFAACGAVAILFRESRSHWNDQVVRLERTIKHLEKDRQRMGVLFEGLLASKDRVILEKDDVIGAKQKIISDLQSLHKKSLADLKQTWKDMRQLQEKYSNFFRVVFTAGAASAGAETVEGDEAGLSGPSTARRALADDDARPGNDARR